MTRKWALWLCSGVAAVALARYGWLTYSSYAKAVAWHCAHGNYAELGHHRVKLPLLWRPVDSNQWDTVKVQRAWPARPYFIDLAPSITSPPEPARFSTEEELVAKLEQVAARPGSKKMGATVVVRSAKLSNLYCLSLGVLGGTLFCYTTASSYRFDYVAAPTANSSEQRRVRVEAEAILSSLQ